MTPREAVLLWERMAESFERRPPEFLSTHPAHDTRIQDLQKWMPEAIARYKRAPKAPISPLSLYRVTLLRSRVISIRYGGLSMSKIVHRLISSVFMTVVLFLITDAELPRHQRVLVKDSISART